MNSCIPTQRSTGVQNVGEKELPASVTSIRTFAYKTFRFQLKKSVMMRVIKWGTGRRTPGVSCRLYIPAGHIFAPKTARNELTSFAFWSPSLVVIFAVTKDSVNALLYCEF